MERNQQARILFITGTGTGVGKTVLTALLADHLRRRGIACRALKPFSSGSRADARLLREVQGRELSLEEINPWHFGEPVAPIAAVRAAGRRIDPEQVVGHIARHARGCEWLLVEGVGGVLVPLGPGFTVLDLILRLRCEVIVVGRNRLGTINHTLLTVRALRNAAADAGAAGFGAGLRVVLMGTRVPDASSASNPQVLADWTAPIPLFSVPFLGAGLRTARRIRERAEALDSELARMLGGVRR